MAHMKRLLRRLLGDDTLGIRVEVYDGTMLGPADSPTVARIVSPDFFHRIITGRASELAFGRTYVAGDVEVEGDIYGVLAMRDRLAGINISPEMLTDAAAVLGIHTVRDLAKLRPLRPPLEEVKPRGGLHSRGRDARSVASHYDVSNDFYRLFLGSTMTYSCALYENDHDSLDSAQINKYDLICRKLGLRPGMRLLDVGCGWGQMVIHAVKHYGVDAVGVTVSAEQQGLAEKRLAGAGVASHGEIRFQDYRDIGDGPFDAISSIGMFEHVGAKRLGEYFDHLERLLVPGGRLLNHAINRSVEQENNRVDPDGFIGRFIFPDGELLESGQVVSAINRCGLEVRHLESLREHYALTLREWVERLESNWDEAVQLTSPGRAKAWRLYMAGSAIGFENNEFNLTQILASKPLEGRSAMALRPDW